MDEWTEIHNCMIGNRCVKIERGHDTLLRVTASMYGSDQEIRISGDTLGQLEERLVAGGVFTTSEAKEIIYKILRK